MQLALCNCTSLSDPMKMGSSIQNESQKLITDGMLNPDFNYQKYQCQLAGQFYPSFLHFFACSRILFFCPCSINSCLVNAIASGLILQGKLLPAIDFVYGQNDCFFDIVLLSTVSKDVFHNFCLTIGIQSLSPPLIFWFSYP